MKTRTMAMAATLVDTAIAQKTMSVKSEFSTPWPIIF